MKKKYYKSRGQTLIEVLAAFGLAVMLLAAVTVAVLTALNNSQFGKNQNLATQYAQQGIEVMRKTMLSSGKYCMDVTASQPVLVGPITGDCSLPAGGVFIREVNIENIPVSSLTPASCAGNFKVTVSVLWSDNACAGSGFDRFCHKTEVISCLGNSSRVPTPGQNSVITATPTVTPTPTPCGCVCGGCGDDDGD